MNQSLREILIVDDTPANLLLLRNILQDHGFRARAANCGRRALESARLLLPDLVLLDITMPEMDGYETCRAFKADPSLADIPIIFVSALDDALDKVKAFECGGVDYIPKPFQEAEVIARIGNQLRISDLQRDLLAKNRSLEEALRQVQLVNEQKTHFLGVVAHDLRNPLSGIALTAELLLEELEEAQVRKDVEGILDTSRSMADLLTRFLDVNRIETGQILPDRVEVDLQALIQDRIPRFQKAAEAKAQTLHLEPSSPCPVQGDPRFLVEVLDNLLSNAVKYSPNGGHISLKILEKGFSVQDQGPGFTEEDLGRVFGRFTKLSAKPTGGEASVGLGLYIVKHMVDSMGGQIRLDSGPGQGACFTVTMPQ